MSQKLNTKNFHSWYRVPRGNLGFNVSSHCQRNCIFTMCIFLSVEKKKPKKDVVVVSTASLKTKPSFVQPHRAI